jgi:hypothetical protein
VGYSSRYHVASLAAVFLALGIGILIGTGLKTVVSDTTHDLASSIRGNLKDQLADAHGQVANLNRELDAEQGFDEAAYPGLVGGILQGERVAVIALGELDGSLKGDINEVVGPGTVTGAASVSYVAVSEPPDLSALVDDLKDRRVGGKPVRALAADPDLQSVIARRAGRGLVRGGPLYNAIRGTLVRSQSGPAGVDAVIITRQEPGGLDPAEVEATDRLEGGILDGLNTLGLPVVGVERSDTSRSSVGLFQDHGLSSVDDLDLFGGRVALAYALRGTEGSFGTKSTADRLMPSLRGPRLPPPGVRGRVHR